MFYFTCNLGLTVADTLSCSYNNRSSEMGNSESSGSGSSGIGSSGSSWSWSGSSGMSSSGSHGTGNSGWFRNARNNPWGIPIWGSPFSPHTGGDVIKAPVDPDKLGDNPTKTEGPNLGLK